MGGARGRRVLGRAARTKGAPAGSALSIQTRDGSALTSDCALAATVLGSLPAVHEAIQSLNALRAKVDTVRQTPAHEPMSPAFNWKEWVRDVDRARVALREVREAAESAESDLAEQIAD